MHTHTLLAYYSGEPRLLQASSRAGSQNHLSPPLGPVSCAPPRPLASPTRKVHGIRTSGAEGLCFLCESPCDLGGNQSPPFFQSAYSFVNFFSWCHPRDQPPTELLGPSVPLRLGPILTLSPFWLSRFGFFKSFLINQNPWLLITSVSQSNPSTCLMWETLTPLPAPNGD